MTPAELTEACKDACELCRLGNTATYRATGNEWVHNVYRGSTVLHTLCGASAIRNQAIIETGE